MRSKSSIELARCLAAYVECDTEVPGDLVVALHRELSACARRVLRRHGLTWAEPDDVATDLLFASGQGEALPVLVTRRWVSHGPEAAVAYVVRSVKNAVWHLHAANDPVGARAFRAVRACLRLLASDGVTASTVRGSAVLFGDTDNEAHGPEILDSFELRARLQALSQRLEFAGTFGLRCPRALGRRLVGMLRAIHAEWHERRDCVSVTVDVLEASVVEALRVQHEHDVRLCAGSRGGLPVTAPQVQPLLAETDGAVAAWPFACLEAASARDIAATLIQELHAGTLGGRRLYAGRRERLSAAVRGWILAAAILDPLDALLATGIAQAAAYDDRAQLRDAVQVAGERMLARSRSA